MTWPDHPNCRCTWDPAPPTNKAGALNDFIEAGLEFEALVYMAGDMWFGNLSYPTREEACGMELLRQRADPQVNTFDIFRNI